MKRPHTIPLTEQTLALLEIMKPISGHREYVFASNKNPKSHVNSQSANMALKRMSHSTRTSILTNNFMRQLLGLFHKNQKCPVTAKFS